MVDYVAIVLVLVVAFGLVYKLRSWFRTIPSGVFGEASKILGSAKLFSLFFSEIGNRVIGQRNVITDSKIRWVTHFFVFWGFIGLAIATVWDDVFYHQGAMPPPFSLSNPGNIIGNIGGTMALVGTTGIFVRYLFVNKYKNSGRGDTVFFVTLYIAIITGFITEFSRYSGAQLPTYASYSIHLAFVAVLLGSAPFTHFFHSILTPFMRYVERLRISIIGKKGPYYIGDRYTEMSKISELVRSGQKDPTKPTWLKKGSSTEEESSTKS